MTRISPAGVLRGCLHVHGMDIDAPEFWVGRELLLMPHTQWVRFLAEVAATHEQGTPEHETAQTLLRAITIRSRLV